MGIGFRYTAFMGCHIGDVSGKLAGESLRITVLISPLWSVSLSFMITDEKTTRPIQSTAKEGRTWRKN